MDQHVLTISGGDGAPQAQFKIPRRKEVDMPQRVVLCAECYCCPAVEIYEEEVWIGEEGNRVKLTIEEWNNLVDKVKRGELKAL